MFTSFAKRRTGKSCSERQTNVQKRSKKRDARAVLLPVFFDVVVIMDDALSCRFSDD